MGVLCEPARPTPARPKPRVDGRRDPGGRCGPTPTVSRPAGASRWGRWLRSAASGWTTGGAATPRTRTRTRSPCTRARSHRRAGGVAGVRLLPVDQAFMKKEQAVRGSSGALAELCPPQHPLFLNGFAHEEPALDHVAVSDDVRGRSSLSSDSLAATTASSATWWSRRRSPRSTARPRTTAVGLSWRRRRAGTASGARPTPPASRTLRRRRKPLRLPPGHRRRCPRCDECGAAAASSSSSSSERRRRSTTSPPRAGRSARREVVTPGGGECGT